MRFLRINKGLKKTTFMLTSDAVTIYTQDFNLVKLFFFERFFSLDLSFEGVVKDDCCDNSCDNDSRDQKELNESNEVSNSESEKIGVARNPHISGYKTN